MACEHAASADVSTKPAPADNNARRVDCRAGGVIRNGPVAEALVASDSAAHLHKRNVQHAPRAALLVVCDARVQLQQARRALSRM